MDQIRKDYEAFAIHRYDWGHIGPGLPSERLGKGTNLADAIRNAGIRCETCEHWNWHSSDKSYGGRCSELHTDFMPDNGGGFCCKHTGLK